MGFLVAVKASFIYDMGDIYVFHTGPEAFTKYILENGVPRSQVEQMHIVQATMIDIKHSLGL